MIDANNMLKQIGSHVTIINVSRPDRDAHMIGKTGIIKRFEKTKTGVFCQLIMEDGELWIANKDNIDVSNSELTGREPQN